MQGGPTNGLRSAPAPKGDSNLRLAYSALSCIRGQCRTKVWGTWTPGTEATWRPRAFSSIAAMLPWAGQGRYAPPAKLAVCALLAWAPTRTAVAGAGFQEVGYYHRGDPCGPDEPARRDTPFVGRGGASADGRHVGGRGIQATRDRCFRRADCAHTGRSMGPVESGFPR